MFSANFVSGREKKHFFISGLRKKKNSQLCTAVSSIGKKKISLLLLPFHLLRPQQMQINILKLLSREEESDGHKRHGSAPLAF